MLARTVFLPPQKQPESMQVVAVCRHILTLEQNHSSDCRENKLEKLMPDKERTRSGEGDLLRKKSLSQDL